MTYPKRDVDQLVDKLGYKLDTVAIESQHTREALDKHVNECSVIQKRVLVGVVFVAGWVTGAIPAVGKLVLKIVPVIP